MINRTVLMMGGVIKTPFKMVSVTGPVLTNLGPIAPVGAAGITYTINSSPGWYRPVTYTFQGDALTITKIEWDSFFSTTVNYSGYYVIGSKRTSGGLWHGSEKSVFAFYNTHDNNGDHDNSIAFNQATSKTSASLVLKLTSRHGLTGVGLKIELQDKHGAKFLLIIKDTRPSY